jgi:hypothetical protein
MSASEPIPFLNLKIERIEFLDGMVPPQQRIRMPEIRAGHRGKRKIDSAVLANGWLSFKFREGKHRMDIMPIAA